MLSFSLRKNLNPKILSTLNFKRFSIIFRPIKGQDELSSNIRINKKIVGSNTPQDFVSIINANLPKMNLINYSTSFKVFLKFQARLSKDPNLKSFSEHLLEKTLLKVECSNLTEKEARSLANLYYFLNKIIQNNTIIDAKDQAFQVAEKLNLKLEQVLIDLFDQMNDQEASNVIYTLFKRQKPELILKLNDLVFKKIPFCSFHSNLLMFYSYVSLDLEIPSTYLLFDDFFTKSIQTQKLNGQDFSQLVFAYSKINALIPEPKIFDHLNKSHVFFSDQLSMLSLATILQALTRYEKPMMNQDFYLKYQTKILENKNNLTDWMLSSILSGYKKWNFGTDDFYVKLDDKCTERCEFFDEKSFSTILHSYASNLKGSTKLYQAFEKSLIERFKKNNLADLSNKNLLFILYSFTHIKETFICTNDLREVFREVIKKRLGEFIIDELAPITALYSTFIKDNQDFFEVLKTLLLVKKPQIIKIKNLAEILKSFAIHAPFLFDKELVQYFFETCEKILDNEVLARKKIESLDDIGFFSDVSKIFYGLIKYQEIDQFSDHYRKVARILEEICVDSSENAKVLFQEPNILSFFKQAFMKTNVKHDFLSRYES